MLIFDVSEVIAILVVFFFGITSLFMIPQWVPAKLAERAPPDFAWQMRAAGVILILVALLLLYGLYEQVVGVIRLC